MDLWIISVGGKIEGANIEVHDVQFAISETIESVYGPLRERWYGKATKLHLDSYLKLKTIDGYRVAIKDEPMKAVDQKLYFAYIGAYDANVSQELHDIHFVVASNEDEAKAKANKKLRDYPLPSHVDQIICIEDVVIKDMETPAYIHLIEDDVCLNRKPDWYGYQRIDV